MSECERGREIETERGQLSDWQWVSEWVSVCEYEWVNEWEWVWENEWIRVSEWEWVSVCEWVTHTYTEMKHCLQKEVSYYINSLLNTRLTNTMTFII